MGNILDDKTKLLNMNSVDQHDNTDKTEQKLQLHFFRPSKPKLLTRGIYDRIRPTGSQCPHMYGLPKTYKEDIPRWPI